MKNAFKVILIIAGCLMLFACGSGNNTSRLYVPDECVYSIVLRSTDADDIDMSFLVGHGCDIAGIKDTYMFTQYGDSYLVNERTMSLINDGDNIGNTLSDVSSKVVSIIDDIAKLSASSKADVCSFSLDGETYNTYTYEYRNMKYGNIEVHLYTYPGSNELKAETIYLNEQLTICVAFDSLDDYGVKRRNYIDETTTDDAFKCVVDSYSDNNLYVYGKYKLVNSITDIYADCFGGSL